MHIYTPIPKKYKKMLNTKQILTTILCFTVVKCNIFEFYDNHDEKACHSEGSGGDRVYCNDENESIVVNDSQLPFRNLVLEGGGAKSISYVGALKALKDAKYYSQEKGYTFENISGTSAGCLFGFIVALDIDPDIIEELVYTLDVIPSVISFDSDLLNYNFIPQKSKTLPIFNLVRYSYEVITYAINFVDLWLHGESPGLSTETHFVKFLREVVIPHSRYNDNKLLIDEYTTFRQFKHVTGHTLTCYATKLSTNDIMKFDIDETPNESIFKAIYASISLPGIFKPVHDNYGFPLIDGGIYNNFPIYTYDVDGKPSPHTLGLSLHRTEQTIITTTTTTTAHGHSSNNNNDDDNEKNKTPFKFAMIPTFDYLKMVHSAIIDRDYILYSKNPINKNRVIYLDSPLNTLDINIPTKLKSLAINRAYFNTISFLNGTNK